jgi:hypothetical protein
MSARLLIPFVFFVFAAFAADPSRAIQVLEARCLGCHGKTVQMAELRLDSREAMLEGGGRGAAVNLQNPAGSLLLQAVRFEGKLTMPPTGKLPDEEIAVLETWIAAGAEWPAAGGAVTSSHWAFEEPGRPEVPEVAGVEHPVDRFLLPKIRAAGLEPAPIADRRTLARRAWLDLHGLPPTARELDEFLEDTAPGAWERLIEKLLSSPRYGEQWGRRWLDLVRYGDTAGFEQDPYILEAWRYRDYVVKSFNDDKPYDRFVKEQIAADELWPDDPEARTGTGFYRVNANRDMLFKVEELNRVERLTDAVDTTSTVFLGLTVGCARCHDHKFDPIPQRDFYRMQAIFAPAVNDRVFLEYNSARFYDIAENTRQFRLRQTGDQIARIFKPYRDQLRAERIAWLDPDVQALFEIAPEKRTSEQQALVTAAERDFQIKDDEIYARLSQEDQERVAEIGKRLVSTFHGYSAPPMAPGLIDVGREAPRTYIALRGNPEMPGEEVRPGFLSVLGGGEIPEPPLHAQTTYRRKALAEWVASAENPLFARVMANRIWQYHFGHSFVDNPSDWGIRSAKPQHADLLDWLAGEFAARGFSFKAMHRLLMTSEAYKRSSGVTPEMREKDPANELYARFTRRRLDAEEIRDAVLLASGKLNLKMGGMPAVPPLDKEELYGIIGRPESAWMVSPDSSEWYRRSLYLLHRRTFRAPMFEAFDMPDGIASCPRRNESTTAPQSLTLLNSSFMMEQAANLAKVAPTVEEAWRRVLLRAPTAAEREEAGEFLIEQTEALGSEEAARAELARALLNVNEFLYLN